MDSCRPRGHREELLAGDLVDRARRADASQEAQPPVRPFQHGPAGRGSVAEAAVDQGLRGPQRRERLATLRHLLELVLHHRGEQTATPVRRVHGHHGHRSRRHAGSTRHREPALEVTAGGHPATADLEAEHPLVVGEPPVHLQVLGRGGSLEAARDRRVPVLEGRVGDVLQLRLDEVRSRGPSSWSARMPSDHLIGNLGQEPVD